MIGGELVAYIKAVADTWVAAAEATGQEAVAAKGADVYGRDFYITQILASYSGAAVGLLMVKNDTTTVAEFYVHNAAAIAFPMPLRVHVAQGKQLSVTLASGGAGVTGKVVVVGYTD